MDQEGENGLIEVTVKDGQPEVKTVKEPVERIVRVGTKPAEGVEWTEEIAFEVKVVEDPELEAGKVETVQQGKPGERVHKTDGTEEVRVKPVDHIIKVGTKCNCDQPTPEPSEDPTPDPSEDPTPDPSEEPTPEPSEDPTSDPSEEPTPEPSEDPTPDPSEEPTPAPSEEPSEDPSEDPTEDPTPAPSEDPTEDPTGEPGESPSDSPSAPGADNNKPAQPQKPGTPPLARTGVNAGGALATVALMMLGGVSLLALRRRPSQR